MVKIPALELDGRNWKIYRAKLIEAAATHIVEPLGVLAGWEENDGSDDWEGQDATAKFLIYPTLPLELLRPIRKLDTAHEMFVFLARRFHDYDPIERDAETKLATCANEDKCYPSAESPTSKNAATGAGREDLPTKALNRGNEDVNDRNVGREDPRTSLEASVKGNSAKSARTTVQLESAPHETQNEPQNSLPLTPRLPIDGKPGECKQEAADGVVMAERTIGTVERAEPKVADIDRTATAACGVNEGTKIIADVDRMALLGREPAERASGVGEGDETERDGQSRLQQIFYCEEEHQCNENANSNVPNAHGLPLEGEWSVCASGETTNSNGDADASNAAIERVYRPSESGEAKDAMEIESEGCGEGTSGRACIDELETLVECCQQLAGTVGDPGRGIELADTPNESEELVTTSVEPYVGDGGGTSVRVHLRCTGWRAGDANGPGRGTDVSNGQTDASRGLTDVLRTSNSARTAGISHGDSAGTYLDVRGAKRVVNATDGVGSHADASSGHWDVQSVETEAITPANATQIVSIPRKKTKPPDLPMETARWTPDAPNGCGSHADAPSVRTDASCVGNDAKTAENATRNVRTRQIGQRTRNSPSTREIATAKRARRWKRVSTAEGDVYVPRNAPVAAIETANRNIVFGRPDSGDEAIAPSVESERAGDGDVDDTTSGGDSDSIRVEAALLAGESQRVRYSRTTRTGNLPVSSWPPIRSAERPYGLVRRRRRRGRLKIERINDDQVSKRRERETTYLERPRTTQPPGNDPNQAYEVYRPRRRRGRIKIVPTNISRTPEVETTHLGRVNATRSTRRPKKRVRRVNKLTFKYRMPGEHWRDDGDYG